MASAGTVGLFAAYWPYTAWPVTFGLCSGGLSNIIYAFGVGYGLSMTANAGISAALATAAGTTGGLAASSTSSMMAMPPLGLAGCGLYAAYGVRLTAFLLRRQHDPSYAAKWSSVQAKTDRMGLGARLAIVAGVSLSQALYVLPLRLATQLRSPRPGSSRELIGWAGVALAGVGLLIEAVADEQKLEAKRAAPAEPVMGGLYSWCRHPNYLGEILFHLGVCGLAASHGTAAQVGCAVLSPLFMVSVMWGAAARLDREGLERYGQRADYREWYEGGRSLVPEPEISRRALAKAYARIERRRGKGDTRWRRYESKRA